MQTEFLLVRNENKIPNIRKVTIKMQELAILKQSVAQIIYLLVQVLVLRKVCADCHVRMSI